MQVLSLFDGMACGMLAFKSAGISVKRYDAYEIDEYAIKTAKYNFPEITENGDVFKADFKQYKGVDFVIGGSPCTYWSVAQKNNRETEAKGMGWELFKQYVRAIKEAEPKYFIYENNYSMSAAIRQSINEAFGFDAVHINSALVSAQTRNRLYWVGKRNADGTYSKVDVRQPEDRGVLLSDILESGEIDREKSYALVSSHQGNARDYFKKRHAQIVLDPVRIPEYGTVDKARPLNAHYANNCGGFESRIWNDNPKKQQVDLIAEPIRVGALPRPNGELSTSQAFRIYSINGKSVTLNAGGGGAGGKTGLYAIPSGGNKEKNIYEVKDGLINIKGDLYPIKLNDGFYIIRKLSITECKRLQTVPEWYAFPVSNAQAYKMLGNGWTVEVIAHLIKSALANKTVKREWEQISIFDVV